MSITPHEYSTSWVLHLMSITPHEYYTPLALQLIPNPYSTGIDISLKNLTSVDIRFWRLKSILAL